jgi:H+/Cl- antiporter ClcA
MTPIRLASVRILFRRVLLSAIIGVFAGGAAALFLVLLAQTTALWDAHPFLLWGLPAMGFLMTALYQWRGVSAVGGNNLIIDAVYDPASHRVPLRMLPLILGSTLLTHLCGGSAGREGTAVQMSGSIASALLRWVRSDEREVRILLMASISAGFASVFGTPLAGAVFGMEVLGQGTLRTRAALPCLVAAIVGDGTVRMLQVPHAQYVIATVPALSLGLMGWSVLAGLVFAGIALLFIELNYLVDAASKRLIIDPRWRTAAGGAVIICLTYAVGTRDYNGLGLPLLAAAFSPEGVPTAAFALKTLFTVITLGVGFKGGEVTPLFVIGATAGATLGRVSGVPMDVMAALGFVAVFAAAAQTPFACVLLGLELFGSGLLVPLAIAIFVAAAVVGQRGIYQAQRVSTFDDDLDAARQSPRLHDIRQGRGLDWFTRPRD